jgi:hypothetical protein
MLWRYRGGGWENITPPGAGPTPAPGYGIAYDTVNDAYGIFGQSGLWIVDAENPTAWIKPQGSGPPASQVHGKWKFDPKRGVFFLGHVDAPSLTLQIWAYRYKANASTAEPTGTVSGAAIVVREPSGTAGMAFRQGEFPQGISSSLAQVGVKNRWPDGSVKLAVVSWDDATISPTSRKTITFKQGSTGGGPVSLAGLRALAPDVSVSLDPYGRVGLGALIGGTPFRTWQTGPLCSEWHWRAPVGSDPTLVVWFYVRLYASGALWVRVGVENGYTMIPTVEKDYHATLKCAGRVIFDGDLKHWARSRWTQAFWYDGRPLVAPQHDGAYLMSTLLFPNFGYVPTETAFSYSAAQYVSSAWWDGANGQQSNPVLEVVPMGLANQRPDMTPGGYSPTIGIVPLWDALYLLSGREDMYRCAIANASAAGTFVGWRDEKTNLPVRWSDRPNLWLGQGDPNSIAPAANTTSSGLHYDPAHHPSFAFGAYIFSGDYYFVEQMQMVATQNWAGVSYVDRAGVLGICWVWVAPRYVAWVLRTLGQTLCITPDDDPMTVDYRRSLDANVQRHLDVSVDGTYPTWGTQKNALGVILCGGPPQYNDNHQYFYDAPWMQNFLGATFSHLQDLGLTGINYAKLDRLMQWSLRHPVGLLGDDSGFPYTLGGSYALPYQKNPTAAGSANSPPPDNSWMARDWATVYAWYREVHAEIPNQKPLMPNAPLFNTAGYGREQDPAIRNGYVDTPSFAISIWGNLMPAISAAVDKDVPGAAAAWARLNAASNFGANAAYFHDRPLWGVVPREETKLARRNRLPVTRAVGVREPPSRALR